MTICAHCHGQVGETEDGILLHLDGETFDHLVRPMEIDEHQTEAFVVVGEVEVQR